MRTPLPTLTTPLATTLATTLATNHALHLAEGAPQLRDSASTGPDFSQLMQQQADRQAALRALDHPMAARPRQADPAQTAQTAQTAHAPPAAPVPRATADNPGRPAAADNGHDAAPARQNAAPARNTADASAAAADPHADDAPADGPAPDSTRDTPRAATGLRPAPAQSSAGTPPQAGDAPGTDSAVTPESSLPTADATPGPQATSTAQWARHRRAMAIAANDLASALSAGIPGQASSLSDNPASATAAAPAPAPGGAPLMDLSAAGAALPLPGLPPMGPGLPLTPAPLPADAPADTSLQAVVPAATPAAALATALTNTSPAVTSAPLAGVGPGTAPSTAPMAMATPPIAPRPAAASSAEVAGASPAATLPATATAPGVQGAQSAQQLQADPVRGPSVPADSGSAADTLGALQTSRAVAALAIAALPSASGTPGANRPANRSTAAGATIAALAAATGTSTSAGATASTTAPSANATAVGEAPAQAPLQAPAQAIENPPGALRSDGPATHAPDLRTDARPGSTDSTGSTGGTGGTVGTASTGHASAPLRALTGADAPNSQTASATLTAVTTEAERTGAQAQAVQPTADPTSARSEPGLPATAGLPSVPSAAGPAGQAATGADRAVQATGSSTQAVAHAGPLPVQDLVNTTAMPQAPQAANGPVLAGNSAANQVPTEARVPVPLDNPGFGAALGAQVSVLVRDGVQTARLQLNPAEMGPIAVQIALDGSAARVDFQADLAGTRAVIEASLPALAGALQEAGFTLAGGGVFQQTPNRQGQGDGQPQPGQARSDHRGGQTGDLPGAAAQVRTQRGLVDLVA